MFKKLTLTIFALISLAGCVTGLGLMTEPVKETLTTSPAAYDSNYVAMAKALNSVGTVQNQDKAAGFVNGHTSASVTIKMQLERDGKLTIISSLAPSLILYNTTVPQEHKRVIDALKPNLK